MIPKVTCCLSAIKDGALDPKSALRGQLKFGSWGWPASNLRADHRTLNFVYIYIHIHTHIVFVSQQGYPYLVSP